MNRKETTAFLSDLLTRRLSGIGKYYGREVSVNWGTRNEKRIDLIEFSPPAQYCTSEIEKGIFVCYEVKSCKEDVFSGNGLNFFGEKNYIVTTMQCWKDIQDDYRTGKLAKHITECSPESSHYYGIMVAVPIMRELTDEYEDPTPLDSQSVVGWELKVALSCRQGPRKKSMVELLFCMLRSGK